MTSPKNWLETMQALEAAATKGSWHFHGGRPYTNYGFGDTHLDGLIGNDWKENDAAFIAASRTFVPRALECIRELVDVFKRTQFTHVCYPSDICDLCAAGKLIDETLTKWRLG